MKEEIVGKIEMRDGALGVEVRANERGFVTLHRFENGDTVDPPLPALRRDEIQYLCTILQNAARRAEGMDKERLEADRAHARGV